MALSNSKWNVYNVVLAFLALVSGVLAGDILKTNGYVDCGSAPDVQVQRLDLSYDKDQQKITFNVAGSSEEKRYVKAYLSIDAYGKEVYYKEFDPCGSDVHIKELCPIPASNFDGAGTVAIEKKYADMVPGIAFQVPDLAATATLELKTVKEQDLSLCVQSRITNGKTAEVTAVKYATAGVLGVALVVSGASAASSAILGSAGGAAGAGAGGGPSPGFADTLSWVQSMAMNGMLSVNYPPVYRSFTKNFAFSTGLLPWHDLQVSIDNFRKNTGGNITRDGVEALQKSTLVFGDNTTATPQKRALNAKRALEGLASLVAREEEEGEGVVADIKKKVSGLTALAEQLSVPKSNTFMTVLLIVAIVIGAIVVSLLLTKVILEVWALYGNFPKSLGRFRQHYWGAIARTITSLILLLYGIWVLYCVFQFTHGDSWAAKTLAAVTLVIFTAILGFFSWKIWNTVHKLKSQDGNVNGLFENKEIWVRYSLFYESYKKDYWWIFVPTIIYLFAKGIILAVGEGHGLGQSIAQLILEALMLALLLWSKPFERRSGNVISIAIQVVRVLSVALILVFVEQFAVEQTTKTVTGMVLIGVQSALTGLLVILLVWNAINVLCRDNPHRKRRKEMEKNQRDMDTLTPLDARNSLLLDRKDPPATAMFSLADNTEKGRRFSTSSDRYTGADDGFESANRLSSSPPTYRHLTPGEDKQTLMDSAAPVGYSPREPDFPKRDSLEDHAHNRNSFDLFRQGGFRGV